MSAVAPVAAAPRAKLDRRLVALAALALAALAVAALLRGGLLGLPAAPPGTTRASAGLEQLDRLAARARAIESGMVAPGADAALAAATAGTALVRRGEMAAGLERLRAAVTLAPRDLVIGNAYRMEVFRLRRAAMSDVVHRESLGPVLPMALEGQPIAFLESLQREHPSRETTLQLALAWADEIVLNGALEIKAPASVESVKWFTAILREDPSYVPALYGRGLNYLHRPARLVWPEREKARPDAASRDFGACVAIGRQLGGASPMLVASLALALGDAYAKEGRASHARSWWQIARNACSDPVVLDAVRRRFTWGDAEMLDRLEAELEGRMLDLDHPMTDLAIMWR
jgi:hypothetical protein